jgi:PAS domain S-box-containing protein
VTTSDQRRGPESPDVLKRLVAVGRALAETRDQVVIFRILREFVAEVTPFDTFLVSLVDSETRMRWCAYCWGDGAEVDVSLFEPLPINDGPPSRAITTGQPVVSDDLPSELPQGAPIYNVGQDPRQTRSYLIVPMTTGGRVIGSIQLQSYEPQFYTLADAVPLEAVAGHAASALENSWLLETAAAAQRMAERAAAREATLNRLGALLYSVLDPSEVLATATRTLRSVLGAQRTTFFTLAPDGASLRATYESRGADAVALEGHVVDVDRLPPGTLDPLYAGEAIVAADYEEHPTFQAVAPLFRFSGDRSAVTVPIHEGGRLLGLLLIGDAHPRVWEAEELALARGVAEQVAVALRQSELYLLAARSREEWERTFEAMADAVVLVDRSDRVMRANRAFWVEVNAEPETALGRPLGEVAHEGEAAAAACDVCTARRAHREGSFMVMQPSLDHPLGRHIEVKLNRVEGHDGVCDGMVQVLRDVTALRTAEAELASRQAILDSVLAGTTDAIGLLDAAGRVVWLNSTAERMAASRSFDTRVRPLAEFFEPEARPGVATLLARVWKGETVQFEHSFSRSDGTSMRLECVLAPVVEGGRITGAVGTARDITERHASMERASEGEKLRALGQLAAGVAHDFNNLLASILGHAQLLARSPSLQEPSIARKLGAIERAARDGAETVRRIQNFTRVRAETSSETIRAEDLLGQSVELARPRWKDYAQARGAKIHVEVAPVQAGLTIVGNGAELREVITNLIFNAVDAMPEGGRITLSASAADGYVLLAVRDTGHGLDDETRKRIFEPFFTTRGPQNSGLGLPVSYGIVTRHGGTIEVESEPYVETVFTVRLPAAHVGAPHESEPRRADPERRLDLRVLVVDDDDAVREVVADALAEAGADVVAHASGREAADEVARARFDLVVTDLGMPDVNGWDVARIVRRVAPATPVLLLTGWGDAVTPDDESEATEDLVDRVLAKPVDLDVLVAAAIETAAKGPGGRDQGSGSDLPTLTPDS